LTKKRKSRKDPADKIIVESRAYGRHVRAPRGSKTKAVLNPAMKAHGRRLLKSNIPARLIMSALQPFRVDFKGGMLWQRLVRHFAAQAKEGKSYSVMGISEWDLNAIYPTSRLLYPVLEVQLKDNFSILEATLNYELNSRFLTRKKENTAFRVTIIFLFPDFEANEIITVPIVLPDKLLSDKAPYAFIVQPPPQANSYLICFKAQACANGAIVQSSSNVDKAMCLIGSGTRE
jgi:hypothetical protein